jgi:hypothetical protein
MERFLLEAKTLRTALVPIDLNAGANTGIRIPMANAKRITFIAIMGASTAAAVTLNFLQHTAASSGSSKALSIGNPYYHKHGSSATKFTKVVPGAAADTYDLAALFAADGGIVVFEVLAEDLDVENDYAWVSMSAIDTTAAKVGAFLAVVDSDFAPAYDQALLPAGG